MYLDSEGMFLTRPLESIPQEKLQLLRMQLPFRTTDDTHTHTHTERGEEGREIG